MLCGGGGALRQAAFHPGLSRLPPQLGAQARPVDAHVAGDRLELRRRLLGRTGQEHGESPRNGVRRGRRPRPSIFRPPAAARMGSLRASCMHSV